MKSTITAATTLRVTYPELVDAIQNGRVLTDAHAWAAAALFALQGDDSTLGHLADGLYVNTEDLILALHEEALRAEPQTFGADVIRELLLWTVRRAC